MLDHSDSARNTAKNPKKDIEGAALRTFFNIAKDWKLNDEEQMILLGSIGRSTFYKWKSAKQGRLSHDTLERISYLIGIYKALQILLPNPSTADEWVKKQNMAPLFGGNSALNRMLLGNVSDIYIVRKYLDAQRGGWA
jgi:hypothetical protein